MSNESENKIIYDPIVGTFYNKIDLEELNDELQHGNPEVIISDLITELKRCYANIEWLQNTFELATDYIGEIHHSHWDIFEERMFAAGLWERPSE